MNAVLGRLPAPFRSAPFRWFFAGRSLSFLGSSMVPVALAFAVLDLTGSAADLGYVLAARSIPLVLFLLVGGVIADRFSRSLVLVLSNLVTGLTQGLVAVLLISGHATITGLVVIEAVNGTVSAFTMPAMQGVIPMVVDRDRLQQSNALLNFTRHGMYILGPSAGAGLVVTVGSGWAIAVDALSYLFSAWCMSRLHLRTTERVEVTSVVQDLRVGWGEFVSRSWVWIVVLAFSVMNMIEVGVFTTLGPVIAKRTIGEGPWGLVLSAEAVGFFVMTMVLMRVSLRWPLRYGMLGMVPMALPMFALGVDPSTYPLIAMTLLSGAGVEIFSIGWTTALQEHVPLDVLSRVSSYDMLGSFVALPIGQLLAGPLAQRYGTNEVAVGGGTLFVLIALGTLCSRSVRNLEHVGR